MCEVVKISNSKITPKQPVTSGTKITITCNKGYELIGKPTVLCSGNSFEDELPICKQSG